MLVFLTSTVVGGVANTTVGDGSPYPLGTRLRGPLRDG
jgi:hypothetical protein